MADAVKRAPFPAWKFCTIAVFQGAIRG